MDDGFSLLSESTADCLRIIILVANDVTDEPSCGIAMPNMEWIRWVNNRAERLTLDGTRGGDKV